MENFIAARSELELESNAAEVFDLKGSGSIFIS
jgi:hypothetical protein